MHGRTTSNFLSTIRLSNRADRPARVSNHIVCHAGLVSIRFPRHWLHRSRRPISGTKIVGARASTFTSALCSQVWQVAITARTPFLRMLDRVIGAPGFSRAAIRQPVVGPAVQALPQARSNFASNPAQTDAPRARLIGIEGIAVSLSNTGTNHVLVLDRSSNSSIASVSSAFI